MHLKLVFFFFVPGRVCTGFWQHIAVLLNVGADCSCAFRYRRFTSYLTCYLWFSLHSGVHKIMLFKTRTMRLTHTTIVVFEIVKVVFAASTLCFATQFACITFTFWFQTSSACPPLSIGVQFTARWGHSNLKNRCTWLLPAPTRGENKNSKIRSTDLFWLVYRGRLPSATS